MKNILLVLAFILGVAFSAPAQDSSTSDFKPVAGDKTIEAGASLQGTYYGGNLLAIGLFMTCLSKVIF
jgi:hypothetical protein